MAFSKSAGSAGNLTEGKMAQYRFKTFIQKNFQAVCRHAPANSNFRAERQTAENRVYHTQMALNTDVNRF